MILCLTGCDRNYETIFEKSPDARAQAILDQYNDKLTSAPNGWKASLYTGSGAGYFFYFDFNEDGTVNMLSDFNEEAAGEIMEGAWVLKALQRTTLSFTTYSYIHLPADPDGNINNGIPGSGLLSDFEFAVIRTAGDTIIMKGLQHNADLILIQATAEETQAFIDKRIQQMLQLTGSYLNSYKGYRLTLPDQTVVPMALTIAEKLISFQYLDEDGETIRLPRTSYTFSVDGIVLKDPLIVHGFAIQKLLWNNNTNEFYVPFETPASLIGSDEPFIFQPATPLYSTIGQALLSSIIPYGAAEHPVPAQSDEFTDAYNYAATQMFEGPYRLTLENIKFIFPPSTDRMFMVLTILQPVSGGGYARFNAQYTYSYQVRDGGIIKFKLEGTDENAGVLYADMIGILNHFDNDTFKMEYVGGSFNLVAGFFSQEEVGYHFGAYIVR
jgi:hypothetical protein